MIMTEKKISRMKIWCQIITEKKISLEKIESLTVTEKKIRNFVKKRFTKMMSQK